MDWGTYASNAVVSGNSNGLLNVMDNYDKVKEFFSINLDAFITAASLKYFGMASVTSKPTINGFAHGLKSATKTEKRRWLHEQVSKMLDKFVMDGVSELQSIHDDLTSPPQPRTQHQCRQSGCTRKFVYVKCLLRHEQNVHGLKLDSPENTIQHSESNEESKDDGDGIYEYGCLTLSLGLLLRDADDAVKEGDGERLSRIWKFLTFLYRVGGNDKYAVAGLRLTASHLALLSPRQSHQLKWNRTAATESGPGRRMSRDLMLENCNLTGKGEIKALGFPNINNDSIVKTTKSIGPLQKVIKKSDDDLGLSRRHTHHCNKRKQDVFSRVLNQVHNQAAVFDYSPGRRFSSFPDLQPIFKSLKRKQLHRWIRRHKKKWHRQNKNFYRK